MSATKAAAIHRAEPTKLANVEDIYPMSPMQQGLLFHCLYEPGSAMYVLEVACKIEAGLNLVAFRRAWEEVIRRHAALRTAFLWEGLSRPMQVVRQTIELPWTEEDWREFSEAEQKEKWKSFQTENRSKEFDFKQAPMMRLALMRTGEKSYYFAWTGHHIVLDGWCWQIVMGEILSLYDSYCEGRTLQLKSPRLYRDYLAWLRKQDEEKAEAFWRDKLQGFHKPIQLGIERDGGKELKDEYGVVQGSLSASESKKLEELARDQAVTVSTVVQAAWALVLARYSGAQDLLFGATVSGRSGDPAFEETVGLFINTLPVRVQLNDDETIASFLKRLQQQHAAALEFESSPLVKVQEWSEVPRGTPLFENIIVFENYPVDAAIRKGAGSTLKFSEISTNESNSYPLAIVVRPGDELSILCHHNQAFEKSSVQRLTGHLITVLQSVAKSPDLLVGDVSLLTCEEREQVVRRWNGTEVWYPERSVQELIEEQAGMNPEVVALEIRGKKISYGELNERANQVAHYLRKKGVGPEVRVGVSVSRSAELVVGLLGVLKAGGAYVPLDPGHPAERLRFMMEDAGVKILLSEERLLGESGEEEAAGESIAEQSRENPARINLLENLAYVLYTSGSTGKPKGVGIEHRSLMNYIWWARQAYELEGGSGLDFALYSSISFDLTVTSIFTPLISGGCIYVYESEYEKENLIERVLGEDRAETVKLTPSHLSTLGPIRNERLKQLVVGGEALESQLARRVTEEASGPLVIWNEYGPTETTVACVLHRYQKEDDERGQVPIGKAGANAQIYILDGKQEPVPVGIAGEIYIGGAGVARGYMNRAELTAERFVPDPFSEEGGRRLYRTGDRGRYREEGTIEYLGRQDEQVKYHGYRVELNEIRLVLNQYAGIRDSVIVVEKEEGGSEVMVAYYVSRQEQKVKELRGFLEERLIAETVPNFFVHLTRMPLTLNGKVNYRALPGVKEIRKKVVSGLKVVEPRTVTEELVAGIWCQVLQMEKVGVEENFFELGGHSLLATQVISRIRSVVGVELGLREIFETPTVGGLAEAIERQRKEGKSGEVAKIGRVERGGVLPLSFAQQRLWFIDQLEPNSSAYNVPFSLRLSGELNRAALERSLKQILQRHEVLRTSFPSDQGIPTQKIDDEVAMEWEVVDLSHLSAGETEVQARKIALQESARPFDLANGPLFRVKLLQLSERENVLVAMLHHIISDAWSLGVMVREFTHLYRAFIEKEPAALPELPVQYADFAVWQREWLQGDVLDAQLAYWKEELSGVPVLQLPTDRPRPAVESHEGGSVRFELDRELTSQLSGLCQREGATLFMAMLAAFQTVLGRYSGQTDIAVGTDVANRNRTEIEGLIGFFVNELVLRTDLSGEPTFRELLGRVRQTTLQAYEHQDLPFERVVEEMGAERDLGRAPLFQVSLVMQNAPLDPLELPGITVQRFDSGSDAAKFDLQLVMSEDSEGGVRGNALYATDLFDRSTVERLVLHMRRVLESAIGDVEQKIEEISLLTCEEREQVVRRWNGTEVWYPERSVQELIEEQAGMNPEVVALEIRGKKISYGELNERANQVAHYLRKKGVGPEVRVGVSVSRSAELVVGLLGVLKAGGAYVPLDPGHPAERLRFMMEDAGVKILLSEERLLGESGEEEVAGESIAEQSRENPARINLLENLAYVLYTSGSTGKPKGVGIEHRSLMNYIWWARQAYELEGGSGLDFALYSSISFDLTVTSIFTPLISGGCIYVYESEYEKENLIERVLGEDRAETVKLTPSHLSTLGPIRNERLKQLVVGGEALESQLARRVTEEASGPLVIWNEYGPTETTVACVLHRYQKEDDERGQVPIGKAGANAQIYILDGKQEPVPVGIAGEIYIGGAGVARGYMNRAELTAERFVPDPFSEEGGRRLYRTGDRGRYREEGTIEYLGRQDEQVKYHGYRVELNEIRLVLNQYAGIRDSVIVVEKEEGGSEVMVAYYVSRQEQKVKELRGFLEERLIAETVPNFFVHLTRMPLTLNGKVNYRALPGVKEIRKKVVSGLKVVEPRTVTEELVAGIWCQVLQMEKVGVEENFFELGGHSLLATQVISRIRSVVGVELGLREIFETPTVGGLAEAIERQRKEGKSGEVAKIGRVERGGVLPLSFAQQRLWFIDQLEPNSSAYNVPFSLRLSGKLDHSVLQQCVREVVVRHEILRTTFPGENGVAIQSISDVPTFGWEYFDLRDLDEEKKNSEVRRLLQRESEEPFNLAHDPLLRVRLLQLAEEEHRFLVTMHHIISDGWSMNVMAQDFARIYEAVHEGNNSKLPELEIQYADYAVWQREWLQGEVLAGQLNYWKKQLAEAPELELSTDYRRSALATQAGRILEWKLPAELSQQLMELSTKEGATLFMTLMAGWQLLMSWYAGQNDVTVGTPVVGRPMKETEALIGFFVNTLVIRTQLNPTSSFRELLKQVRETTLDAYAHQDIPFEKLVEELQPKRQLNRTPLFQVMFSWMNAPKLKLELPGLQLEQMSGEVDTAKFEIVVAATETAGRIQGAISYRTALFSASTIQRMMERFERLLAEIARNTDRAIGEISLLSTDERRHLLTDWSGTATAIPQQPVQKLFEQQAKSSPDAVALLFQGQSLTYRQLNRRANQLARTLLDAGAGRESRVGVCAERGPELVTGLLAILKAGAAYLPLDPEYPATVLNSMLQDARAELVLSQTKFLNALSLHQGGVIPLEHAWDDENSELDKNPPVLSHPQNLAYVMFTSGSTGKPKGTMITHEAIVRLVINTDYVQVRPSDRMAHISTPTFDAATFEIWGALLNGATLLAMPKEIAIHPQLLACELEEKNASTMFLTTALFNHIAREAPRAFHGLRAVLLGGELVDPQWPRQVLHAGPPASLLNVYGPTEATTFATWFEIKKAETDSLPIGQPIKNTKAFVLDESYGLVPVGMVGELYLGGPGLARGYANQPELTAERFIPNLYCDDPGERLYRTGDLVKRREDGAIEFVGRRDHQIKLRGFRVELGEIEAALNRHEAVTESCVLLWGETSEEKRLAAYVVVKRETDERQLRDYLQQHIASYEVPAFFTFLEELPLTANGKVNRRALPAPHFGRESSSVVLPRTPVEEKLAKIWSDVLKLDQVSVEESFFDLGGHSLLATQLMSRIRQEFAIELPLRLLFESPTIAGLALRMEEEKQQGSDTDLSPIQKADRQGNLPLSFAQQRLWFLEQLAPENVAYNVPFGLRLTGAVNTEAIQWSVKEIVKRHEVLRTTFSTEDGIARQNISETPAFGWEEINLQNETLEAREAQARKIFQQDAVSPFSLASGPLLRLKLLHLAGDEHVLIVNMHHIVSDGWSVGIMVREFAQLHNAFLQGVDAALPALPIQYADFAIWQREWLKGSVLDKQLDYWKKQLSEVRPLELATDRPRGLLQNHSGQRVQLGLGRSINQQMKELSRREGTTMFMNLLGALQLVLSRYTSQTDITVGTDIANRNRVETEGLIGFFVNELAMRTDLSGNPTIHELFERVKKTALEAFEHQDLPFEKLVEELQPERDLERHPIFQISLVLQNAPEKRLKLTGVEAKPFDSGETRPKLDLELVFTDDPEEGLRGSITYATDLFDESTIERFGEYFCAALKMLAADPEQKISELDLLSVRERTALLVIPNTTNVAFPRKCVQQLFEEQVKKTPTAVAVECGGVEISYRELNMRTNQLAHHLRSQGVGPETRVGVYMRRGLDLYVSFFAIQKAGGVYVPLDPDYPAERLRFMVDDSKIAILLIADEGLPFTLTAGEKVVSLSEDKDAIARSSPNSPKLQSHYESLSYVMYTSGSTGKPKGALIEQRGMVNHLFTKIDALKLTAKDSVAQNAPSSFDISIWQFLAPLLVGARIAVIQDDDARDPWKTLKRVQEQGITVLETVPTMLAVMIEEQKRAGAEALALEGLRCVISNAEALPLTMSDAWTKLHPHARLMNTYGATECSDDTSYCYMDENAKSAANAAPYAPLGTPVANTTVYVLDPWLQPVPTGATGELYIGGICLGRGYWNQPAITAAKFIPNPFSELVGERLYRTGDLGKWCADGTLQFAGRVDNQLKIRGHRIEVGEIEAALNEHPAVEQAIVVPVDDHAGGKQLLGCVVPLRSGDSFEEREVLDYLAQQLPDYMVPASLLAFSEFPMTPSGKVDRKALAAFKLEKKEEQPYNDARNIEEEILCGIFSEVLGRTRVSITESFFELGGHSLMATQIISRIRTTFKVELPLRALFEAPTVAGLAVQLKAARGSTGEMESVRITKAPREGKLPLSFAQQRLWVLDQLEPGSVAYNIPFGVRLEGTLDKHALRWSLNEIVRRHEVLRTSFQVVDGEPVQKIEEELALAIEEVDLTGFSGEAQEEEIKLRARAEAVESFDLAKAPLVRLKLLCLAEQSHVLLVNMHHIVSDGWSAGVIMQEFTRLYEACVNGEGSPLPELPLQYLDFTVWQREYLQGEVLENHLKYWTRQLAESPVLELPTDRPRPALPTRRGERVEFKIPDELKAKLEGISRRHGTTLYMTLLAGFQVLLGRYSSQKDFVIGVPIAGRTHAEVEPLIGMFFNVLAMRADLSGNPTVEELLARVRETALAGYAHQELPFERLVAELELERDLSYSPLFQVIFEMNNTPQDARALPGLRIEKMWTEYGISKVDLTLSMIDSPLGLFGTVQFSTDLFDLATIERMMRHYVSLLRELVKEEGRRVGEVGMLSEGERAQVVEEWNRTREDLGEAVCLQELFEEQARRRPDGVALVAGERRLSYKELDERSNQVGHYLRGLGVGPEVRVGICVSRSEEMVIGLLGILKSGGAYVPLDGSYPEERVRYMVEDSGARVVLIEERWLEKVAGRNNREGSARNGAEKKGPVVVCVEREWEKIGREPVGRVESGVEAGNMAYIYYTSGSTGRPKGVVMAHAGIVNYMRWGLEAYEAGEGNGAAVHSSIAVDLTLTNFLPLFAGKEMVLVEELPGVEGLVKLLRQKPEWSLLKLTPTHLTLLNPQLSAEEKAGSTRVLVIGADNLVAEPTLEWREQAPGVKLLNEYGPTETVVGCSIYRIGEGAPKHGGMPIGKPIANMTMYVLDENGEPLPVGVAGELYIGGVGVARGYWGRAALTAEKFVPDMFGGEEGSRFYRTGDRARFLEDGNIEFLGRVDHQVKIRGYRIEPGEVEAVVSGCPGVQKAMVIVREDVPGEKRLVGYVAAPGGVLEARELREYVKQRLPEYMVPTAWVVMEALPVRGSGKIDPKDLPKPEMERSRSERYVEPRTEAEKALAEIWKTVLGVKQVGVEDNFFELGGDSILSIQVITRAREAGLQLMPRQMFERQTIAELAEVAGREGTGIEAEQGVVNGEVELTPIQEAFFEWELEKPEHYNQSVLLEVESGVDTGLLEEVMLGLLDQHDGLRMRYEKETGGEGTGARGTGWRQWCETEMNGSVYERKDLSGMEDEEEQRRELRRDAEQVQGSLDLSRGGLVKAVEYELGPGRGRRLLLTIHHLVVDGVSWRILVEDLERGYGQLLAGEELEFGPKTTSYQQWAAKLQGYGASAGVREELEYWANEERRVEAGLPRDEAGRESENVFSTQKSVTVWLEEEETRQLLQEVPQAYQTQINDVLLAALGRVCGEWSGRDAVLVDVEGHGREEEVVEGVDLSRTVGWFTSMYPVVLEVGEASEWEPGRALSGTKELLRGVPGRGMGYGVLRYGKGNEETGQRLGELPQAEISFNYLGQIDQVMRESKLFRPGRELIGSESAAGNRRQHVLGVSGIVAQGRLQMDWNYSETLHRRETIAGLAQRYLECLRQFIAHCLSPDAGGFTPSDFELTQMTSDALRQVAAQLDD